MEDLRPLSCAVHNVKKCERDIDNDFEKARRCGRN
jgi:hypothetical protein